MDGFRIEFAGAAKPARTCAVLLGLALLGGCSTQPQFAGKPPFTEAVAADFIARYYSDDAIYVIKPPAREGRYQSICDRATMHKLARQQPGRGLAVILLMHDRSAEMEEPIKIGWVCDLTSLGYRRIVFLRGDGSSRVNGLAILEAPRAAESLTDQ